MINPITNPEAWHRIRIGTTESPGIADVGEFVRTFDWDEKKGKGTAGASLTFTSRPLSGGTITFSLWTADHFDEWESFRKLLDYDTTKRPAQAVDIYHPSISGNGIKSVVVAEIGNVIHKGKGLYTVAVKFKEYSPPPKKSATSTPTGSGNGPRTGPRELEGTQPAPVPDQQAGEIAALLEEAGRV